METWEGKGTNCLRLGPNLRFRNSLKFKANSSFEGGGRQSTPLLCFGRNQPTSFHVHSNWLQMFGIEKIEGNCSELIVVVDVFKRKSRKKIKFYSDLQKNLNFIFTSQSLSKVYI